jgi:ferredoxin
MSYERMTKKETELEAELAALHENVDALRMAGTTADRLAYFDFTRPAELCIGCGACTQLCPTDATTSRSATGCGAPSSPAPWCVNSRF